VKRAWFVLAAVVLAGTQGFPQQQTNDAQEEAMKVLRRAMQDYQKNPKAAEEARRSIEAGAKAAAEAARTGQPAAAPLAGTVAPAAPVPAPAPTASAKPEPSFAEMEQMYLDGKISAKDFQKYLQNQKLRPVKIGETVQMTPAKPVATATVTNTPGVASPGEPAAMTDVEKKLDDLIRAQAEREKASTNQVSTPTGPKTKRQKLDDLLKQLIDGKISDEDYKAQRTKVLAEPD
jgi:hypothetical protein